MATQFEDKAIMSRIIWVGAVAYDPKVVTIWEGMRRYFHEESRLSVEVVLFQSYEMQVSALSGLSSISVFGFNSPGHRPHSLNLCRWQLEQLPPNTIKRFVRQDHVDES